MSVTRWRERLPRSLTPSAVHGVEISARALGVAAVVLMVLWPQVSHVFGASADFYLNAVTTAAITTMLVISLNLAMGYAGLLSFVQTGLLAVGGYAAAVISLRAGLSPWLAFGVAVALTAAVAALITLVSLRATNIYWGLITLSVDLVLVQIAQQWTSVTGGFNGLVAVPRPSVGSGALSDTGFYYLTIIALALVYIFQRNIVLSGTGRRMQAVKESDATAQSLGVSPHSTRILAFTLAGAVAGLAGALYAQDLNFISPDVAAQSASLGLFIALFLGGFATLLGPLIGMVVVTVVQVEIRGLGAESQLVLGCFLLAAIFLLPRGVVGTWRVSRFSAGEQSDVSANPSPQATMDEVLGVETSAAARATDADREPILSIRGLSKAFGGVAALREVDIDLLPGEVHGLIGPNGAGKSTLVSCLSGQLRPDAGVITFRGRPLPRSPHRIARLGITRVFQIPHLFEHVSVVDNVLTGMLVRSRSGWLGAVLRVPGFRREERGLRGEAADLLRIVGLEHLANRPASVLSHGQRRLVEILRAVATRPVILVLDEPGHRSHSGRTRGA